MTRAVTFVPIAVIIAYMTVGEVYHFRPDLMRILTLLLLLAIVPSVYVLSRHNLASAIEKSFAVFMAIASAGFWFWPEVIGSLLTSFSAASLYSVLFLAAAVPPLLGWEPFTAHIARRRTPPAVWETDIFKRININLTWIWAAVFAACVLSSVVPPLIVGVTSGAVKFLFQMVIPMACVLGIGLPLSKYYPDYYQRKVGMEPVRMSEEEPVSASVTLPARPQHSKKEEVMREKRTVVAINGSPHETFGSTSQMIEMLRESLAAEDFDLEEIVLNRHRIDYCTGCIMCLEKGNCWINDDHRALIEKVLEDDAIILAAPVYFLNVPGQMKTFLDRSLGYGHRPRGTWKPGLSVSVSAGYGETWVAEYLGQLLRVFGAFSVGRLTAIAAGPGEFLGKEAVEARAADLSRDLARAVREGRRYPATDHELGYWQFMGKLVRDNRDLMEADYKHWEELGLFDSFEAYTGQSRAEGSGSPEMRKAWIKDLIRRHKQAKKDVPDQEALSAPQNARTARELLKMMPLGLNAEAAAGLAATYQFEVTDGEDFTAHLRIENQKATFHEGPAAHPDIIIRTPAQVWLSIARGDLDGAQAFMSGKYKAEGDVTLLMKLNSLFSR
jgi:multimeric flavodoxin WrbA/putative sterol carrier protein